jgi:hypothetical protein
VYLIDIQEYAILSFQCKWAYFSLRRVGDSALEMWKVTSVLIQFLWCEWYKRRNGLFEEMNVRYQRVNTIQVTTANQNLKLWLVLFI